MNYHKLSIEELNKLPHPNLIAEIMYSGYSFCTIGDFMGIGAKVNGHYRKQDDKEILDRLDGTVEISVAEALGLAQYYNVPLEYLFSETLTVTDGKPYAYWRWFEKNIEEIPKAIEITVNLTNMSDEHFKECVEYVENTEMHPRTRKLLEKCLEIASKKREEQHMADMI